MAALAAEGVTIHPAPAAPTRAALPREDSYVTQKEATTPATPMGSLPDLTYQQDTRVESLQIQEPAFSVSKRIMVLRELSCYLSLYISGYK